MDRFRSVPVAAAVAAASGDIYAPDVAINKSFYVQQVLIEQALYGTIYICLYILVLGHLRSFGIPGLLKATAKIFMVIGYMVTYIPGLMSLPGLSNDLYIFWMAAIAYIAAVTNEYSCYTLADNEERKKRLLVDYAVIWPIIFRSLYRSLVSPDIIVPIIVILWVVFLKFEERRSALMYASATTSSNGFSRATKVISDFSKSRKEAEGDEDNTSSRSPDNSNILLGLREANKMVAKQSNKIVSGLIDFDYSNAITLDKILNTSDSFLSNSHIREVCHSFSMFTVLLAKVAGYGNVDTKLFEGNQVPSNAFPLVRLELRYFCEYLFTNYYVIYDRGLRKKFLDFAVIIMFLWLSIPLLVEYRSEDHNVVYIEKEDTVCTNLLIIVLVIVEFIQVVCFLNSRWAKVMFTCYYLRYQTPGKPRSITASIKTFLIKMVLLMALHAPSPVKVRPGRIGQYSILESYSMIPKSVWAKCWIGTLFDLPRIGQVGQKYMNTHSEMEQPIIDTINNFITKHKGIITNGVCSLRGNDVQEDVIDTYVSKVTSQARVILIWHIVTCLFEDEAKETPPSPDPNNNIDYFKIATTFSKYSAYLVAFVPEVLPDHVYTAQCEFDETIKELQRESMKRDDNEDPKNQSNSVVKQAHELKEILGIQEPINLWKTLADFWTERLFFLALSDHPGAFEVHANGLGQYITQLWALLTHAGCSREPIQS